MTTTYRPLLDILTEGRTDGCDFWGMRSVRPDFTSSRGFRWPFPGGVAEAPGPVIHTNRDACPQSEEVVDLPGMARAAKLSGADLYGADLYGADLRGADLRGADADQYTRWPEGFNPATAGVS